MRKLQFAINFKHLQRIEKEIVPALFTQHQFHLLRRKCLQQQMSASEKNEFSRSISRKMRAINALTHEDTLFLYNAEKMILERMKAAKRYVRQLSRRFKNKHILISGSFLYKDNYNDIDV
ncbi:hypothetical protein HZA96_01740, partial [Candidatus Woesearchaeota archaeon]|nr:hypothetical protein [Candidatus Woesearchaeota archaeon]